MKKFDNINHINTINLESEAVLFDDKYGYIFGGRLMNGEGILKIFKFNNCSDELIIKEDINIRNEKLDRYGHAVFKYDNHIFFFGG